MAMEQLRRAVQRARRDDEQAEGTIDIQQTEGSAEVVEDAECCLTDIDAALDENACCLADVAEVTRERTYKDWREMTDQELIDMGDPHDGFNTSLEYNALTREEKGDERAYYAARAEWKARQERYDQAYQTLTGMTNHRSCGCGCG